MKRAALLPNLASTIGSGPAMVTGKSTILLASQAAMAGTGANTAIAGRSNRNSRMAGLGRNAGTLIIAGDWKEKHNAIPRRKSA
ncbi:hypothetical protein D9M73_146070 [compost metagenome]